LSLNIEKYHPIIKWPKMWHMISSSSHADDQPVKKQFVHISHYHDKLTGILLNTFKCVKKTY